ncbi:kinase-like domain-containing protein [Mycena sanguinolenta]|nr:kinase-like domain-containing protein [Mycena sanguinolenta]
MSSQDPYIARAPRFARNLEGSARPLSPRQYLGHGGFSDVIKGTLKKDDEATLNVAIKRMRFNLHKSFLGELHTWSKLNHPNILELLGYIDVDNTIGIVSPLIMDGDATSYFSKHRTTDPGLLLRDVAEALSYIHNLNIYHGDLKGANILVSHTGRALLTDFGASKVVEDSLSTRINNYTLTLRWAPPERINGSLTANAEGDVYSFGMTALELCTLMKPYNEHPSDARCIIEISSGRLPQWPSGEGTLGMSDAWWALFEACCCYASDERPKIGDILRRIGAPAYNTVRSIPNQRPLFNDLAGISKSVDLTFLIEGAGLGDSRQILLTLTSPDIDAQVVQHTLAWKVLNFKGRWKCVR